jgi:hypothetical protein
MAITCLLSDRLNRFGSKANLVLSHNIFCLPFHSLNSCLDTTGTKSLPPWPISLLKSAFAASSWRPALVVEQRR